MRVTRVLLATLICTIGCQIAGAATIYDADFTVDGVGFDHTSNGNALEPSPQVGPNFTLSYPAPPASDTSLNTFITSGGAVVSDDFGGEGQLISTSIDVSSIDSVDIAYEGATAGSAVFNATSEFFEWFYTLDASPRIQLDSTTSDGSLSRLFSGIDTSTASSLQVGFRFNINGAGDGFSMSSITVDGEETNVPEPSSVLLAIFGAAGCLGLRSARRT